MPRTQLRTATCLLLLEGVGAYGFATVRRLLYAKTGDIGACRTWLILLPVAATIRATTARRTHAHAVHAATCTLGTIAP